jgi:hypothetical protein
MYCQTGAVGSLGRDGGQVTKCASIGDAIAAAETMPCKNRWCQSRHVVAWVEDGVWGAQIFDGRRRRSLAAELAELYPRQGAAPPVEYWPTLEEVHDDDPC